jgi:hypothetical protein
MSGYPIKKSLLFDKDSELVGCAPPTHTAILKTPNIDFPDFTACSVFVT